MNSTLGGAVVAAALAASYQALAHGPAPLVPTALVEEVKSASANIEFMDYVGTGQRIELEPTDVLVLSYLKSCEHETITGGTVRVGLEKSEVQGGKVSRRKVPCNGGNMKLSSQEANATGASSFRLQNASFEPTVYALPPVIEMTRLRAGESRTLIIERVNRPSERFAIEMDESLASGGFFDLAKSEARLQRGASYTATYAGRKMKFKIDARAETGKTPVVSRLLRFPPG
jgi:hypothetical protein